MKKHLLLRSVVLLVMLTGAGAYAQTTTQNYVRTRVPRTALKTAGRLDTLTGNKDSVQTAIQYLDGLGRPLQTVQVYGSPTGKDVVQPQAYDQFGREPVKYQPYTVSPGTAGMYQSAALTGAGGYTGGQQYSFYQQTAQGYATTTAPYAATVFELSPLDRVTEQGAPGAPWQPVANSTAGHTVKMAYTNNNTTALTDTANTLLAALYTAAVNSNGSRTLNRAGNNAVYGANQLNVTLTRDENWTTGRAGTAEEYKDKAGRVVLKRSFNWKSGTLEILSTYYVYDDKGLLAYVLPPGANPDATGAISGTTLNNFCYQYRYDSRGRLAQKRLPGKGWEFVVYNALDQPVATQDSMQRTRNQWLFTKYDAQGRAILTGIWDNGDTAISQSALQSSVSGNGTLWEAPQNSGDGYTASAWPASYTTLLSASYYDTYSNIPGLPGYSAPSGAVTSMAKGQLTASKVAVLNNPADMLWSVHYYDDEGRALKAYQQHYLAGTQSSNNYDEVTNTYNFSDEVTATIRNHHTDAASGATTLTIANNYTYDHMGRKLKTYEQINGGANIVLSNDTYNELGQLYHKGLHGQNDPGSGVPSTVTLGSADAITSGNLTVKAGQSIDITPGFSVTGGATFSAGIAGYLQTITYAYNERGWLRTAGTSGSLFNMELKYDGAAAGKQYNGNIAEMDYTGTHSGSKVFTYGYDKLNRLTGATSTGNTLDETLTYDVMGNIQSMSRGGQSYSALSYTYAANQLTGVTGSGFTSRTYAYDGNGNATSDGGSKTINYNLLNLPQSVTQSSATLATYTYDATGNKLRNISTAAGVNDGTWDYVNGIVYHNGNIDFVNTEEGRAERKSDGSYNYEYDLKDHLGNNRVSMDSYNGAARVIQEDEYYSFGLRKTGGYDLSNNNRYLYNGKELQTDLANQYDYGARFYDPVIARWTTVDPLAEKGRQWSAYNYGLDNPVKMTDPDGMWPFPELAASFVMFAAKVQNKVDKFLDNAKSSTSIDKKAEGKNMLEVGVGLKEFEVKVKGHKISVGSLGGSMILNSEKGVGHKLEAEIGNEKVAVAKLNKTFWTNAPSESEAEVTINKGPLAKEEERDKDEIGLGSVTINPKEIKNEILDIVNQTKAWLKNYADKVTNSSLSNPKSEL